MFVFETNWGKVTWVTGKSINLLLFPLTTTYDFVDLICLKLENYVDIKYDF